MRHKLIEERYRVKAEEFKFNLSMSIMTYCDRTFDSDTSSKIRNKVNERVFEKININDSSDFHLEYFDSLFGKYDITKLIEDTCKEILNEMNGVPQDNKKEPKNQIFIPPHYREEWEKQREALRSERNEEEQ